MILDLESKRLTFGHTLTFCKDDIIWPWEHSRNITKWMNPHSFSRIYITRVKSIESLQNLKHSFFSQFATSQTSSWDARSRYHIMSGHVQSLDEISKFCDLSDLGEFHCFLGRAFALHVDAAFLVFIDIGAISNCPRVKVTQGHACHGPFPWLTSAVQIPAL